MKNQQYVTDEELRSKCLEYAISILSRYEGSMRLKLSPIEMAKLIYKFIKTGEDESDKSVWPGLY